MQACPHMHSLASCSECSCRALDPNGTVACQLVRVLSRSCIVGKTPDPRSDSLDCNCVTDRRVDNSTLHASRGAAYQAYSYNPDMVVPTRGPATAPAQAGRGPARNEAEAGCASISIVTCITWPGPWMRAPPRQTHPVGFVHTHARA